MMAIESAAIPLPSELIMPLAGWKLIEAKDRGVEWVLLAGLFGAIGNTRRIVDRLLRRPLRRRARSPRSTASTSSSHSTISISRIASSRAGATGPIFGSRLLPVVRTFISVPAGISRVPIWQFTIYTFAGAFIWSTGLAYGGYKLGENWEDLRAAMRPLRLSRSRSIIVLAVAGTCTGT